LDNVKEMLEETTIRVGSIHEEFDICNFPEFQNTSYDNAVKIFKQKLSEWATKKYGSKEKAARKLNCNAKTLGNQHR